MNARTPVATWEPEGWAAPVAGMTWGWPGVRGQWHGEEALNSLREMAALGVTWVTIAYAINQPTAQSLTFDREGAVSEEEIRWAVTNAHALGLKVCLKPTVNCADGTWRAYISFLTPDVPGEPTWTQWFEGYGEIINRGAELAAELDAEMFCVGCEMVMAEAEAELWRELIVQVRTRYNGLVTYNCDKYQEDRLSWWDAVDVISSSGYYPEGTWEQHLDRIEPVVRREGKPFVFMEGGCPSRASSPARPNDWALPGEPSEAAQAGYLEEALTAVASRSWTGGMMLWDWPARLYSADEAASNDDYCMYAKAGAGVVERHYRGWTGSEGASLPRITP